MAEKLCGLKKKGGGQLSETVLWTNPNPTDAMNEIVITTSDNISNYKYLSVKCLAANNNLPLGYIYATYDVDNDSANYSDYFGADVYLDVRYHRMFNKLTDTTIQVWYCLTATNGRTSSNASHVLIPQEVIGLK